MNQETSTQLSAGWASREFTPPPGTALGGYGARVGRSGAAHDPLLCQALAIGSADRPFVLLVADVVAVGSAEVHAVRTAVRAATAVAEVWVCATHTHSGPDVDAADAAALAAREALLAAATSAARAAIGAMAPAYVGYAHGMVAGIGSRRNTGGDAVAIAGAATLPLDVIALRREAGSMAPDAVLAVLPCHATVLGADNLSPSADLPGAFRSHLCAGAVGAPTWAALAQGAAGDVSTRRTRRAQTFEEASRLGGLLADAARDLALGAAPLASAEVRLGRRTLALAPKASEPMENLERRRAQAEAALARAHSAGDPVAVRQWETARQGAEAERSRPRQLGRLGLAAELAVAALGELAIVAVPGELYLELGERLRLTAGPKTIVLGYANGYVGYLPPTAAFGSDDYEPRIALVAPGEAERLVGEAARLVRAVRPTASLVPEGGDVVTALRDKIGAVLDAALLDQRAALTAAAAILAQTIRRGGIIHTFGTGHSHLLAEEPYSRAGGLANVHAIQPSVLQLHEDAIASGAWERLSGAAAIALDHAPIDLSRDCLVVISQSGRNAAPVEAALWARARAMPVVAITSLAHSRSVPSLAPGGERLFEVADVSLDNGGVSGDASLALAEGVELAPMSTIGGAAVMHAALALAVAACRAEGVAVPVIRSGNLPGAHEDNARTLASYAGALPALYDRYRARARRAGPAE